MTNKIFYINNLSFGTELEERVYDKISFDIIDRNKSQIHQISIVSPGELDEMNVDFNNYGINAERNNGVIACLLARAMINGKLESKSALTEDEINKLKLIWTHLIECRLIETDCADDEMIFPSSRQVQLIISSVIASGNSELFRFISKRLGSDGLDCAYRYDIGIWPDSFFYPGRNDVNLEMVDILFRHWLSRVFIRVYSVTEGANDNINPQFASLIHERLTSWAYESSKNAEIVLRDLKRYKSIFNNDENDHNEQQILMHWFSIFCAGATEEFREYMPYMISDRFLVIVFSRKTSISYTEEKSKFEIAKESGNPGDMLDALLSGENPREFKVTLKVVEEAGGWRVVGKSNARQFVNKQKLAQVLCDGPSLSTDEINQYMNDKFCLIAAGVGADRGGIKRAYKEQKDISSKGHGLEI